MSYPAAHLAVLIGDCRSGPHCQSPPLGLSCSGGNPHAATAIINAPFTTIATPQNLATLSCVRLDKLAVLPYQHHGAWLHNHAMGIDSFC